MKSPLLHPPPPQIFKFGLQHKGCRHEPGDGRAPSRPLAGFVTGKTATRQAVRPCAPPTKERTDVLVVQGMLPGAVGLHMQSYIRTMSRDEMVGRFLQIRAARSSPRAAWFLRPTTSPSTMPFSRHPLQWAAMASEARPGRQDVPALLWGMGAGGRQVPSNREPVPVDMTSECC